MVDLVIPTLFGFPPGLILFVAFVVGFVWGIRKVL